MVNVWLVDSFICGLNKLWWEESQTVVGRELNCGWKRFVSYPTLPRHICIVLTLFSHCFHTRCHSQGIFFYANS